MIKILPLLAVSLGLLLATVAPAQQTAGELLALSYKYEKHEIPKHILLRHFLLAVPTQLEDPGSAEVLLDSVNLKDPRAASILLAAANRYLDIVSGGQPMIVRETEEDDGSTTILKHGDSSAPEPPELAGLEGDAWAEANHERSLDHVRHLAEVYASLNQDLKTIGLETSGIDTYLDQKMRLNTTVTSDKPFIEGSPAWEVAQTFDRHLATQER